MRKFLELIKRDIETYRLIKKENLHMIKHPYNWSKPRTLKESFISFEYKSWYSYGFIHYFIQKPYYKMKKLLKFFKVFPIVYMSLNELKKGRISESFSRSYRICFK